MKTEGQDQESGLAEASEERSGGPERQEYIFPFFPSDATPGSTVNGLGQGKERLRFFPCPHHVTAVNKSRGINFFV